MLISSIALATVGLMLLVVGLYEARYADRVVEVLRRNNPWWLSVLLARLWYRPLSFVPIAEDDPSHPDYVRYTGRCDMLLGCGLLVVNLGAAIASAVLHRG